MASGDPSSSDLRQTPLTDLHRSLGARLVPFAGYEMPVQYKPGIIAEHTQTREKAGLFDVSHMGVIDIAGGLEAEAAIERLLPVDLEKLPPGTIRYSYLLNTDGGIIDDLMIARNPDGDGFGIVANASNKDRVLAALNAALPAPAVLRDDVALIALQGPTAVAVFAGLSDMDPAQPFMSLRHGEAVGIPVRIARSGYTGEDGIELTVPAEAAVDLAQRLLDHPDVAPVGLGARDTLRLECGLCLHGNDIDESTTPVEAGLTWAISKRRRQDGGFTGAPVIQNQLQAGPSRKRVGLAIEGKAPVRGGAVLSDSSGAQTGSVTSGGFSPTLGKPIAMGYVETAHAATGEKISAEVRGRQIDCHVTALPFVPQRYFKPS
ncbi:MAG: glycine cleavage system aminomethyltransferase GcvT [Alphaproteobacteria bacterium]